jgi:hypothetical protein
MGKVGSKTVVRSLRELARSRRYGDTLDMPFYHVHFLTQSLIDEYLEKRKRFLGTDKQGRLEHIWLYEYLRGQLDTMAERGKKTRRWKVVTLTRETVGRNVSNFFELCEAVPCESGSAVDSPDSARFCVRSDPDFYDFAIEVDTADLSELLDVYLEKPDHNEPGKFFEQEIKGVLGIDVYQEPFPVSKGYTIYHTDRVDLLLIRLEDLDRCANQAFDEFLGIPELPLVNENIASDKAYASLYRTFKSSVSLPESYIDAMYSTQYMRHFYADHEIAEFRKKWTSEPRVQQ